MIDWRHTQESIPSLWDLVLYWIKSPFRYESACYGGLYNHHYYLGNRDKVFDIQNFPEETYFFPAQKHCALPPKDKFVPSPEVQLDYFFEKRSPVVL